MTEYNDQELIIKYLKGDHESLEVLITRYLRPIYGFVLRIVGSEQNAEDITQDVFVKAWRNLKKFDKDKSFKTWIFTIAKNASLDFLKKKKALAFSDFENDEGDNLLVDSLEDPSPLPTELLEQADIAQMLSSAIDQLSLKYKMILHLHYSEQLSLSEISELLSEPPDTIKSRHRRAIIALKKILLPDNSNKSNYI